MSLKDKYLTISQASKEIGVSRQSLYRGIAKEEIPTEKIGGIVLILKSDIKKLVCPTCEQVIKNKYLNN